MEIFKLFGSIFVDSQEADDNIKKTTSFAGELAKKIGEGASKTIDFGKKVVSTSVDLVTGLMDYVEATGAVGDRVDKMSQKLGLSREGFQEWDYILGQNGISIDSMGTGFKKLTDSMDGLKEGSKKNVETFSKLDETIVDLIQNGASQEAVFSATIKAFQDMEDGAEKAALANELFGRSGQDLMPLLNGTSDDVEALRENAHALGLVLSDEAVDSAVLFGDTLDDVKKAFAGVLTKLGSELMPLAQKLLDWVIENMPAIQKFVGNSFTFIGTVIEYVISVIAVVMDYFSRVVSAVAGGSKDLGGFLTEIFKKFTDTFDTIGEVLEAFIELYITFWKIFGDDIISIFKTAFDIVYDFFDYILKQITNIFKLFSAIFKGDWQEVWDVLIDIFAEAFAFLIEDLPRFLKNILDIILGFGQLMFNAGASLITSLWDGIKGIWSAVADWVSEKMSWLMDKLQFWKKSKDEMNEAEISDPKINKSVKEIKEEVRGSHRTGLSYVPFDGYIARLHEEQKVLTKDEAKRDSVTSGINVIQNINIPVPDIREAEKEAVRQLERIMPQL